jgi:dihydroorotase
MAPPSLWLREVQLLEAPGQPPRRVDALIQAGELLGFGVEPASAEPVVEIDAGGFWLAPCLVDPHSVLEDPFHGRAETLASLRAAAAAGGYGTVALLPWAPSWRDRPERLQLHWPRPMRLLLWGGYSRDGGDEDLAAHADQLAAGAIGLAAGDGLPPLALLERGLRLGEMGGRPVLVAPREASLAGQGFVRERVEALRAGWPPDPPISEILPLQTLLTLAEELPGAELRLMNLSTREALDRLARSPSPPLSSVCWWHLVADSGSLDPAAEGWRLVPALGGPGDREALIAALAEGRITAVAIHHLPLDAEERLLPLDQRRAGLAGHGIALSLLWRELVERRGWPVERLWEALCWGPARFLAQPAPRLGPGSRDWLLYDPGREWIWNAAACRSLAANQPCWGETLRGRVVASGLSDPADWCLPDCRPR